MPNTNGPVLRQWLRRQDNPLFPAQIRKPSPQELSAAEAEDQRRQQQLLDEFNTLVEEAVALKPTEESERLLELKMRLDQCYVKSAAMAGDLEKMQGALVRLIELIMQAIRRGAADDPTALQELDDEEQARQHNYRLLAHPLVADLMLPDTAIDAEELTATLLSSDEESLTAVLWLFDAEQLGPLCAEAEQLVERLEDDDVRERATERLSQMQQVLESLQ